MSEYLQSPGKEALQLASFIQSLIEGKAGKAEVVDIQKELADAGPEVFISAVDYVVKEAPVTLEMKKGISKMLNVFYKQLNSYPKVEVEPGSFLDCIRLDNEKIKEKINSNRPGIKEVQSKESPGKEMMTDLLEKLKVLKKIDLHYQLMENVVFPFLESQWPDHRCFQVLWSLHDDVRSEISNLERILALGEWDLKAFNRLTGDLFFNINTIIFREEKIILPAIVEADLSKVLDGHLGEAAEIGWSFIETSQQKANKHKTRSSGNLKNATLSFETGQLEPEQVALIFNHLPVDITFVDENDTVQYFSTPPKRTFTRTPAVIGRKVQNCHPPESVHMVEKIVEAFRNGEKDEASFWIPFKDHFVLIQYFALRDSKGEYKGTIEVTQDIAEIKELKGEKRLLNWSL